FATAFAPQPRLLESTETDTEVGAAGVVAHGARAQLASPGPGPVAIGGVHRCIEAVDRVVGQLNCVFFVFGGDHHKHRPEYLLLGDRRAVVDTSEKCWLDIESTIEVFGAAAS